MKEVEGTGWYIKRLLWFLLVPVFFLMPFQFLHQLFVLAIPTHNCKPPANLSPESILAECEAMNNQGGINQECTLMNRTEWKSTFLPLALAPDYVMRPSQCEMYNVTSETLSGFLAGEITINETVSCREVNGFEYDTSEFINTVPSEQDWVCDKGARATDLYTIGTAGLIVGTAFFSWFADWRGRRPAFFVSTLIVIIFQLAKIGLADKYTAYLIVKIIAFGAMLPLFQSPLNITTEMCDIKQRGFVIGVACVAWAVGNMLLPLIGWAIARWVWITVASVVPMVFVFFTYNILPESPRWLITTGRLVEAEATIRKIAEVNKAQVPEDLTARLKAMSNQTKEKSYGYISLFSTCIMSVRTICICVVFTSSAFIYYQLMINIGNMAGNTFLNLFLLGIVEGPGSLIGVWVADKLGRRWTHAGILLADAVCFFILIWIVHDPSLSPLATVLCMIVKFNISATFTVAYVQAMELFPTNVRQSGIGIATFISQTISIGGPYVIYLGATDLRLPYVVMFIVCVAGVIAAAILPETAGRSLPETLADAQKFGKGDKFFSWDAPIWRKESPKSEENGEEMKFIDGGKIKPAE